MGSRIIRQQTDTYEQSTEQKQTLFGNHKFRCQKIPFNIKKQSIKVEHKNGQSLLSFEYDALHQIECKVYRKAYEV